MLFLSFPLATNTSRPLLELYVYPIKSTYGIKVTEAEIGPFGFKYDREWMLVDEENNFISQRTQPKVCSPLMSCFQFLFLYFISSSNFQFRWLALDLP